MLGQSMLPVEFRDFEPEHYRRLVEIYNSIYPGYDRSISEWQFEDEHLDRTKYHLKRYACAEKESGKVLGFGQVMHPPWMFHPRKFFIDIWVDPKYLKQKIGASIYDRLNRDLAEMKAITVWAQAREDMPWSSSFLDKRGFHEKMRAWESRLNPSQVNPANYEAYPRKVSGQGITISTLAEERTRDPEWERKLYELIQTVAGDMPMPEQFTPASFEQWQAWEMKSPNLVPEGYMIAKDGTRYVGASVVWRTQEKPTNLWQGITGVRREYRGRGIAVALKLRIVDYAARSGFDMIRTFNDSTNAPMLGINMKIGFKREIGWITFEKHIA